MKSNNSQNGYVALISAVLMFAVLLVLAAPLALSAFWARFDILGRENKKIALNRARACADLALLKISRGENKTWDKCEIVSNSDLGGGMWEVIVRADCNNSFAGLKVIAELQNQEIKIIQYREF